MRLRSAIRHWQILILITVIAPAVQAQETAAQPTEKVTASPPSLDRVNQLGERNYELEPGEDPQNRLVSPFIDHVIADQKNIWTAPRRLRTKDLRWIVPFAAGSGLLIASDSWLSKQVPLSQVKRSQSISDYATYSLIAGGGGAFLWGHLTKNDHLRETGLLAGEAAINSTAVSYALKTMMQRPRPLVGNGNGTFFQGGTSFPSEHSAIAWSVAGVVAHEYPGPLTKLAAYGLASAVTMTRVTGKQHFPSDVIIGSALGWYFAHEVYRAHHDHELGGAAWGDLVEANPETGPRDPRNMGSPPVPPDSWVYPLFERLAALGYVQSAYFGMRPWTRMECARLLEEADERIRYDGLEDAQGQKIYAALSQEFHDELGRLDGAANLGISVDSVYVRGTNIAGTPLRDGYHFAQTIINDYGRPYWTGFNNIAGLTAHAVAGPLSLSVQGEYQHAPAMPSFPSNVLDAISTVDAAPGVPNGTGTINRFRLLSATVGLTYHNVQFSFGRQAQWLGINESGPFLYSNNSEPITSLQIQNVSPYHFPLLSNIFGPARTEFFLGQLSGQTWVYNPLAKQPIVGPGFSPQPFIHGEKISFKPTSNLEFGMGITAIFGGPGLPFTLGEFFRSYYSHKADIVQNPGKRFSEFDISYRIPHLRNWLVLYNDSLVGDEISPILSGRPLVNPGIYLPHIPKISKLDLRVEATRDPMTREFGPGFVYFDRRYRSGYTNGGNLIGSWIGRAGIGGQAWATYWFSPRNKLQFGYRHQEVDQRFLQGGRLNDFTARGEMLLSSSVALQATVGYEQWKFPLLAPGMQQNVTASFQLTFSPHWRTR